MLYKKPCNVLFYNVCIRPLFVLPVLELIVSLPCVYRSQFCPLCSAQFAPIVYRAHNVRSHNVPFAHINYLAFGLNILYFVFTQ